MKDDPICPACKEPVTRHQFYFERRRDPFGKSDVFDTYHVECDPPFAPCAIVFDDPKRTEMVLRDCSAYWVHHDTGADLAYDMETNVLVGIRIYGDVLTHPRESGSSGSAR